MTTRHSAMAVDADPSVAEKEKKAGGVVVDCSNGQRLTQQQREQLERKLRQDATQKEQNKAAAKVPPHVVQHNTGPRFSSPCGHAMTVAVVSGANCMRRRASPSVSELRCFACDTQMAIEVDLTSAVAHQQPEYISSFLCGGCNTHMCVVVMDEADVGAYKPPQGFNSVAQLDKHYCLQHARYLQVVVCGKV